MLILIAMQSWYLVMSARLSTRWSARSRTSERLRAAGERGQTTAEYALVLIGAAALALLLIAWATRTDRVGKLFDFVMDHITGSVR
jgi:Flp pilus assembly pilin Flp